MHAHSIGFNAFPLTSLEMTAGLGVLPAPVTPDFEVYMIMPWLSSTPDLSSGAGDQMELVG